VKRWLSYSARPDDRREYEAITKALVEEMGEWVGVARMALQIELVDLRVSEGGYPELKCWEIKQAWEVRFYNEWSAETGAVREFRRRSRLFQVLYYELVREVFGSELVPDQFYYCRGGDAASAAEELGLDIGQLDLEFAVAHRKWYSDPPLTWDVKPEDRAKLTEKQRAAIEAIVAADAALDAARVAVRVMCDEAGVESDNYA